MAKGIVKPCKCEATLLCSPIAPCELLPRGIPGSIEINGTEYATVILGYLPEVGEPVVDGYRLTKYNGESHDLCLQNGRLECTCGDWIYRRAAQQTAELADCKHVAAVKQLLPLPVEQAQDGIPSDEYAVSFDDF